MKRKIYDSPTAQVVQLEHQAQLLDGSDYVNNAIRGGYGTASTDDGTVQTWE